VRGTNSSRRSFLGAASQFAAACIGIKAQDTVRVPWSAGIEQPRTKAAKNAADCHHHIYDSRFPVDAKAKLRPGNATVPEYRLLQKRIGTTRNVIVQPSTYGVDNRCMLDALRQCSITTTRGIAVVNTDVAESTLRELQVAGVCGIRFNLVQAGATTADMIQPLSNRVASLGWHVEINAPAAQIEAAVGMWKSLPVPVVFDHLGHVSAPGTPAFGAIADLLQRGKCWMTLSGAYIDTKAGPPTYADSGEVAKVYIKEAPERLVWGTDWPHPTTNDKPDDALLFDLFAHWCPNDAVRTHILVENPAKLYGFS
jgi:D-galactarolactone isomerase